MLTHGIRVCGADWGNSVRDRFWLDLRTPPPAPALKAWREHPYDHDWPGFVVRENTGLSEYDRMKLDGVLDLLIFFRTVTPSAFCDYGKPA